MRKILGVASLIMSTCVVHAEQLNEQEKLLHIARMLLLLANIFHVGFNKLGVNLLCKVDWIMPTRMVFLSGLGHQV